MPTGQIEKEVLEMESNNQQLSHSTLLDPNQGLATGPSLHHGEGQATGTSGLPGTGAQQPAVTEKIDIDQFKEGFMELNLGECLLRIYYKLFLQILMLLICIEIFRKR